MTSLFTAGMFRSHSGIALPFKIDCDALTDDDLKTLARRVSDILRFNAVVGIPNGGLRFSIALQRYVLTRGQIIVMGHLPTTLIVDDVLTTGNSIERERARLADTLPPGDNMMFAGLVIFARAPCPNWVRSIFQLGDWIRP